MKIKDKNSNKNSFINNTSTLFILDVNDAEYADYLIIDER